MSISYICFLALTLLYLISITTHAAFFPVSQCPNVDLEQASGFKCSNSSLKLHCIRQKDACQLGLVCLPWSWMSTNKCPVYSMSTFGIHNSQCIGNDTQCPHNVTHYKSFEANKYPGCFVCENKLSTTTTVETKSDNTTTETKSSDLLTYVYVLIVLLMISVLLNIILIVLFRKPISRKLKGLIYCNNTEMKNSYGGQISGQNEENSQTRLCCINIEDSDQVNEDPNVVLPEQVEPRDDPGSSDVPKTDFHRLWK